ncbi:hypothetical protein KM92DES2_10649 [uncultured Desulfovibrio sp.]|uniref:Uncharacterized protein n=1 Tax=uncultured Desulfovibrio sp. TaxID=167968 RepID=A0A212J7E3_9BACT|nr:hypothetical protein KM92DES2_10649 [uncultured Desulfovibrio sp.]
MYFSGEILFINTLVINIRMAIN